MTMTRSLRDDEQGQSPFIVMTAVVVFILISAGLAASLIAGIQASGQTHVNSALYEQASSSARAATMQGYPAVASLPAQSPLTLTVGQLSTTAHRTVEVDAATNTARVTITVGRFDGGSFADAGACTGSSTDCITVSELVSGWLR